MSRSTRARWMALTMAIGCASMLLDCGSPHVTAASLRGAVRATHVQSGLCLAGGNPPLRAALGDVGYLSGYHLTAAGQAALANGEIEAGSATCYSVRIGSFESQTAADLDRDARFVDVPVSLNLSLLGRRFAEDTQANPPDANGVSVDGPDLVRFAPDGAGMIPVQSALSGSALSLRFYANGGKLISQLSGMQVCYKNSQSSEADVDKCERSLARSAGVPDDVPLGVESVRK